MQILQLCCYNNDITNKLQRKKHLQRKKTLTTQKSSFVFRLKITLLIDITDDLSDDDANESVRSKVQAAVCMFQLFHSNIVNFYEHFGFI